MPRGERVCRGRSRLPYLPQRISTSLTISLLLHPSWRSIGIKRMTVPPPFPFTMGILPHLLQAAFIITEFQRIGIKATASILQAILRRCLLLK